MEHTYTEVIPMCGRYSLAPDESREILEIIRQVQDRVKVGEIFPTNPVPVLMEAGSELAPEVMAWGYPRFQGKSGAIINARSETALERPMFRRSVMERRCVFPTTGFYEWGSDGGGKKQKYRFNLPGGGRALFLAGLWNDFAGERRCVILTTAANASMEGIHDRMPLVLERSDLEGWVRDSERAAELLHRTPPELAHVPADKPPPQLSLFS